MNKTYVLITIDAETNISKENGFWSYCVNGYMPDDLESWIKYNIVSEGSYGFSINREKINNPSSQNNGSKC